MRKVILAASALCMLSVAANAQRAQNSAASATEKPAQVQGTQVSAKGNENPYHMYKGISDPIKAKEAWVADHPHLLNQGHGTVDHSQGTPKAVTNNPVLGRREDVKQEQTTKPESK